MTRARRDGLYFLLLGSLVFLLLGIALLPAARAPLTDFRGLYYPARCLIQHHDPYMEGEVLRIYRAEQGDSPSDTVDMRQVATRNVYPPTTLFVLAPFAMLPWGPAHLLWIMLTAGSLIFASYLIWNLGADYAPILSGALIGFLLANSEVVIMTGNATGIAISLCVVAVWCFLRERFVLAGVPCLAISLPGVLWVWLTAPHWMAEIHANFLAYSAPGGINDPRSASMGPEGVIDLQSAISVFWADPRIYNPVSWLLCAAFLLVWVLVTMRFRFSPARAWLALAAISAFSMLPVYHRQYDAKLLLLTVPACAMLWAKRDCIGRLALLVSAAGLVVTGDLPWVIFLILNKSLHLLTAGVLGKALMDTLIFSAPLTLLAMSVFYLWVYARSGQAGNDGEGACEAAGG